MPGRNGAVARGPAPPIARTLPVLSPRSSEDAAHLSDSRVPVANTQRTADGDPLAGPGWESAGSSQPLARVRAQDR